MMLARVADSLYWMGRYVERAEHMSRALADVMLNATLDRSMAANQVARIALVRSGRRPDGWPRPRQPMTRTALRAGRSAIDGSIPIPCG